jgi:UDP-N-acetylglucosamine--N-acetylmuramyl-(pentapeptide) pyrophosphoryl-undecaprenol N-acetylglucosamine transferase
VRHQAGSLTIAAAREAYKQQALDVELLPYIENMAEAYAWADLVVCRAGALTVAELSAAGLGAIFVPYPTAVDDHQTANARSMAEAGAAAIMADKDLNDESLAGLLQDWLSSRDELKARALKARALAKPDALRRITDICLELAGARV